MDCCAKPSTGLFKFFAFCGAALIFAVIFFALIISDIGAGLKLASLTITVILFAVSLSSIFGSFCGQTCCCGKIAKFLSALYFLIFLFAAGLSSWIVWRNGVAEVKRSLTEVAAVSKSLIKSESTVANYPSKLKLAASSFKLLTKHLLFDANQMVKENIFGFEVNSVNYQQLKLLLNEVFVFQEYPVLSKIEKTNPLIIDCGGNIGMTTMYFKMLFPDAKILAFEASKNMFDILKTNIQANNLKDVELVNKAVAGKAGKLIFYEYGPATGSLLKHDETKSSPDNTKKSEVEAVQLSSYITQPVDLLKMDIEGAESEVLLELAAANKLKEIKQIVMEYHYSTINSNKMPLVLQTLEQNGFTWILGPTNTCLEDSGNKTSTTLIYAWQK